MVMRSMRKNIGFLKWVFVVVLVVFGIGLVLPGTLGVDRELAMAAAVVNGKAVPQQRFSRALTQQLETARREAGGELSEAESRRLRRETLQALVDEELALQHAQDLGQAMSQAEFRDAALNDPSLRNEQGVFDPMRYQQLLAMQALPGQSVDEVEKGFQRGILLGKVRGFWEAQALLSPQEAEAAVARLNRQVKAQAGIWDLARVKAGLSFDEERLRTFYSRNRQRWAVAPEYKLSQILLRTEFGAATATTKAKAEDLLAKLKAGADFKAMAAKENADEEARKARGELGWFKRDDLRHPELQGELNFLKPGGYSQVVQTPEGFHILRLEAKKEGFEPTFANTRAKAETALRDEEGARVAEQRARQALADLKAGKPLAEAVAARGGSVVATGWFGYGNEDALPALGKDRAFADLMLGLDLGEPSPRPVATSKAVAIGVLTEERPGQAPAKAEEAQQRRRLAVGLAQQKKAQALYDAWMEGLRQRAKIKDNSGLLGGR